MEFKSLFIFLAVLALAGCSLFPSSGPTPLPTVVLQNNNVTPTPSLGSGGGVSASGIVAPAQEAQLASTTGGSIKTVNVAVGDKVKAGQALVQLAGQESLQAAVSAAQFGLVQAEQAIEDLNTQAEADRVQAMQDIVTFQQAVKDAQYTLDNFTVPSNQANLDSVDGLKKMKQLLDQARTAFEPYKNKPSTDPTRKDLKKALDEAQADYNAAVRRLQYEYDLQAAQEQLATAERNYGILKAGPDPARLKPAEARRLNAQNQMAAAQAALDNLTLTAPFSGTVSKVNFHGGEWVTAGQPIVDLADLDHLRVETTDLSERDVPQVKVGQPVIVYIKALGQNVPGHVAQIAPLADTLGGDVVYKTTIDLDTLPPGLRAGMSVDVRFGSG